MKASFLLHLLDNIRHIKGITKFNNYEIVDSKTGKPIKVKFDEKNERFIVLADKDRKNNLTETDKIWELKIW